MSTNRPSHEPMAFGTWLQLKLAERGWTQREAAQHLGVGHASVGRWINGRKPEANLIERIADVFVTDYDYVATLAGVRPKELLEVDPDSATARLTPLIEQVDWVSRPGRLEEMENELRYMVDVDRRKRQIAKDRQ